MTQSITVVLGMHRSGTSLCAGLLQALGLDMAENPHASPANARGHWERPRINDLNERVLGFFGRGWGESLHAAALPDHWWEDARVRAVRAELVAWIAPRLGSGRFGFKDPRAARLLPMWHAVFAELGVTPRFVLCLRDPAQVARSLAARDRMAREQAEYRWAIYNAEAVTGLSDAPVCLVPYEAWFTAPEPTACRLARFVAAGSDPSRLSAIVAGAVDPALRHDEPSEPALPVSRRLHQAILNGASAGRCDATLRALCTDLGEFSRLVRPMLVEAETLRAGIAEQNRVISDLDALVRRLRREAIAA